MKALHDRSRARKIPLMAAAAELAETDEVAARTRTALRDLLASFARWRGQLNVLSHTELAELILEETGYTEMWQADRSADAPGRLENLKELVRSMDEFETMAGFLEHISLVMDADSRGRQRRRLDHDAAFGQGAGVRHGVPARLGGRPLPLAAHPRRERQGGARGGAPPRLCRHHAGAQARHHPLRRQPAHARPLADRHPLALPRRTARGACRRAGGRDQLRRLRLGRLWRQPLRHARPVRQHLRHARLAARPAQSRHGRSGGQEEGQGRLRPSAVVGAAADRGRAGGEERHRRHERLWRRRARLPPEIRLRPRVVDRRQQAHHRVREGGAEAGARFSFVERH